MCQSGKKNNCTFLFRRALTCLLLASGVGLFVQQPADALQRDPAYAQATQQQQSAFLTQAPQSGPKQPPLYKPLRYEEDYSYLKDLSRRTDFWDALNYIPLGAQEGWYLSLGGEIRQRYEFFHHEEAGSQPADRHGNNSYALQRYLLHGDLHLGSPLRVFVQVMSGLEDGRIGGPRPDIDRDTFDIHQAFMDVMSPFSAKGSLTWRLGRQEFRYGSGRLIDVREAPNLRRSFDASRTAFAAGRRVVSGWVLVEASSQSCWRVR